MTNGKMTLDEAIIHCEEIAESNDNGMYEALAHGTILSQEEIDECLKCAEEHRQLAEWLKELRDNRKGIAWNLKCPKCHAYMHLDCIYCSKCGTKLRGDDNESQS